MKKMTLSLVLAGLCLPAVASANPCKSHFQKVGQALRAVGPPIVELLCNAIPKDEAAKADCLKTWTQAKSKVASLSKAYNKNAGSAKMGPRGLGFGTWYTGTLLAERVFIGPPLTWARWDFKLEVTGGKWKKGWKVDVCLVDAKGNAKHHAYKNFTGAKSGTKWSWTKSKGAYGLRPMVYLHKGTGTNGVKFRLRSQQSVKPGVIATMSK